MSEARSSASYIARPRVVLDANILVANFRAGRALKLLLDGARTGQLELIVPEIALREAANKFEERCAVERHALEKALGGLSRIGVSAPKTEVVDPRAERLRYDRSLRRYLRDSKARVPGIARVAHADLVDRALRRRKPFKTNGAGYRDALLWATILEEATRADLLFFTKDSSDFAVDGELAPDLQRDLEGRGCEASSVLLRTDLEAFVRRSVNVETVTVDAVRRALPQAQHDLELFVRRVLFDVDLDRAELRRIAGDPTDLAPDGMIGERLDAGDAQVLDVQKVSAATVERAEILSTGNVLAELYVAAEVGLDVEVDVIGRDARTGRPRLASCFAPARAMLLIDLDATFAEDDLALLELSFYGASIQ